jgi:ABC-type branched-subunit amino acid transport system ATPase component
MASDDLLTVSELRKSFGGLQAVADVSFRVQRGAIYGLIGPNGSGKTTVFNLLTGFLDADGGSVEFQGQPILGLRPFQVARCGICRTFQAGLNPRNMTVMENMLLAAPAQTGESLMRAAVQPGRVGREEAANLERARDILATMMIDHMADEPVGSLSGGQRKLLSLAQALMARPRLILLDEPVAGVNPRLIDDIVEVIRRLRDDGHAAFLIVEHNMGVVRRLCDEIAVLDAGEVIASGPTADTLARDDVLRAYLGSRSAPRDGGGDRAAATEEA